MLVLKAHVSTHVNWKAGLIACLTDSDSSGRWPYCSFHCWQAQAHTCRHTPRSQSMDRNRFWMPSNYHQWMALWDRQAMPCACLRLITHIFHFSPTSIMNFHFPPLLQKYTSLSIFFKGKWMCKITSNLGIIYRLVQKCVAKTSDRNNTVYWSCWFVDSENKKELPQNY